MSFHYFISGLARTTFAYLPLITLLFVSSETIDSIDFVFLSLNFVYLRCQ